MTAVLHPLFTHSQGSLRRLTIVLATFVAFGLGAVVTARGDQVVLTSGSVYSDCSGQLGNIDQFTDLMGQNFVVRLSSADGPPGGLVCSPAPVHVSLGTIGSPFDFRLGFVIYQGFATSIFTGVLSFTETSITGFVEGRGPGPTSVLFRVDFTGSGIGTLTSQRSTFEVVAVPEPATLILLGTGLAGVVGAARRARKARKTAKSL